MRAEEGGGDTGSDNRRLASATEVAGSFVVQSLQPRTLSGPPDLSCVQRPGWVSQRLSIQTLLRTLTRKDYAEVHFSYRVQTLV